MAGVTRGDVVLAVAAGDYGKPRPWLVVQSDKHNRADRPNSILLCPFTTHDEPLPYRVPVDLPSGDGRRPSWVMVDKLMAVKRERVGMVVSKVSRHQIEAVDRALLDLLGFPQPL